ncbi:MAG TPA: aldo/keto reductase [Alphaproteobacteria bacterium]|nr:aldo/keto reductase [Alphaproteobacteria bacterium]
MSTLRAPQPAPAPDASLAGQFTIGGDLTVNRLGFGAMRVTGRGIWGPPADREEALRTLRRLAELNINFIDTADSYGPRVSEELIREALHPYDGLVIATKAGFQRPGPDNWRMDGRPEALRRGLEGSLKRLGVERIDLWQLHRIDPKVPRREQFDAIRAFRKEGLVRHVGLSEVSVEDIREAQHYVQVVTVQNRFHPRDTASADVLAYCENHTIGFIPWAPLGSGRLARPDSALAEFAKRKGATPSQVAIAWSLRKSPVIIAIPGTGRVEHLDENTAAAALALSDGEMAEIERGA